MPCKPSNAGKDPALWSAKNRVRFATSGRPWLTGRILGGPAFPNRSQLLHRATHVHSARDPVKAIKLRRLRPEKIAVSFIPSRLVSCTPPVTVCGFVLHNFKVPVCICENAETGPEMAREAHFRRAQRQRPTLTEPCASAPPWPPVNQARRSSG